MLQKHTHPPVFSAKSNVHFAVRLLLPVEYIACINNCLLTLRRIKGSDLMLFCIVAPENASLSTNLSTALWSVLVWW